MYQVARSLFLAFFVTAVGAQSAQQAPAQFDGYNGVQLQIPGIYMVPAPNEPFSATEHLVSRQRMADGSERVLQTTTHIARTSSGMTYSERRSLVTESFQGEPGLIEGQIYDPNRMRNTLYSPQTRIARETTYTKPRPLFPGPTTISQTPPPGVVESDLGQRTISGISTQGLRRVRTVPAAKSGTGKEIEILDEFWFAPSLSIYLSVRHVDPRTGEQQIELSDVTCAEPANTKFRVPDEYKIIDETPAPPPAQHQY